MKKIIFGLVFLILLFFSSSLRQVLASPVDPQYILVRKSGGCGTIDPSIDSCSYIWNGMAPDRYNLAAVKEITKAINGTDTGPVGTDYRRLGIGTLFTYNQYPPSQALPLMTQSLTNLLSLSLQTDIPVFITLDGYQWWNGRPDLWYWWDPSLDPVTDAAIINNRKNNVEWTCWNNSCAVNKAWRNWGKEDEVGTPPPNILSSAFIQACKAGLDTLLPVIINWYNNLPANKKYLLAGISLANEIDIGINYYYYSGGVQPVDTTKRGFDFGAQLGYAAVKTGNIKTSGTITDADLTSAVNGYLTALYKYAYDMGAPRNKLFVHASFKDKTTYKNKYSTAEAALIEYGQAGWSLYNSYARNPANNTYLTNSFNNLGKTVWSSPEWGIEPTATQAEWESAFRNTLGTKNNLLFNISNWEGIFKNANVLSAIKKVIYEQPSCYITAPVPNPPMISGNNVTLSWSNGSGIQTLTLFGSSTTDMNNNGLLKNLNTFQEAVTGKLNYTRIGMQPGTYYYQLIADGCSYSMRKVSDRGSFVIALPTPSPTPSPTPTPTLVPTPTPENVGDLNHDGVVNIQDFILLSNDFNRTGAGLASDLNHDQLVNIQDFIILSNNFSGFATPTPTAVPTATPCVPPKSNPFWQRNPITGQCTLKNACGLSDPECLSTTN